MGEHINFEQQTEAHDAVELSESELRFLALLAIYNGMRIVKKMLYSLESEETSDGNDENDLADA